MLKEDQMLVRVYMYHIILSIFFSKNLIISLTDSIRNTSDTTFSAIISDALHCPIWTEEVKTMSVEKENKRIQWYLAKYNTVGDVKTKANRYKFILNYEILIYM